MALRDTLESIRHDGAGSTKPSILVNAVVPILREIGWTDRSQINLERTDVDVELRSSPPAGSNSAGRTLVLIKVESSAGPVQRRTNRALDLAAQDGAAFAVVTTGLAWRLHLAQHDGPDDSLIAAVDLTSGDIAEVEDVFSRYLANRALASGTAQRLAEETLTARRNEDRMRSAIPQAWRSLIAKPDGTLLVDHVREEVKKVFDLDPTDDQIVAVIKRTIVPDALPDAATQVPASNVAKPESETMRRRPTGYQLWGEHHNIRLQREILTGVAEALYQRHADGFERVLRASQSFTTDPTTRKAPIPIGASGYYHEGALNRELTERLSIKLLREFGYSEDDLIILYSTPNGWETTAPPVTKRGSRRRRRRASHRPTGINLWGTHYPTQWQHEVLAILAVQLHERHADRFDLALRITQITRDPTTCTAPAPIGSTGYFYEKAIGSNRLRNVCDKLLETFGYPPRDLELTYE